MRFLFVLVILSFLSSCGTAPAGLAVQEPWVRQAVGGQGSVSAAYMIIANNTDRPDVLLRANADIAEAVELHAMEMDGAVMRMGPVPQVELPARSQVRFEPSGLHIMLIGLKGDLTAGSTVSVTLTFQEAGSIQIQAPVR
jgi:periplasmic copper chaperone A